MIYLRSRRPIDPGINPVTPVLNDLVSTLSVSRVSRDALVAQNIITLSDQGFKAQPSLPSWMPATLLDELSIAMEPGQLVIGSYLFYYRLR